MSLMKQFGTLSTSIIVTYMCACTCAREHALCTLLRGKIFLQNVFKL